MNSLIIHFKSGFKLKVKGYSTGHGGAVSCGVVAEWGELRISSLEAGWKFVVLHCFVCAPVHFQLLMKPAAIEERGNRS